MRQIEGITDNSKQDFSIVLDDGSLLGLSLIYRPTIQRWSFDITHEKLNLNGKILCTFPNLLRVYRNNIPFGIMIFVLDSTDPIYIDDFLNDRAQIYILSENDVQAIEDSLRSLI